MSEDKKQNPLDSNDALELAKAFSRRFCGFRVENREGMNVTTDKLVEWFKAAMLKGYDKGLLDQAKNYANAKAQELGEKTKWSCDSRLVEERLKAIEEKQRADDGYRFDDLRAAVTRLTRLEIRVAGAAQRLSERLLKLEESK